MAIKKKPVVRKRLPAAAAPADETQQDNAADELAPQPVSGPSSQSDDELALQAAPETNYPGEQLKNMRRRRPPDAKGTTLDVHDTSKLLVIAWVVIGAVIIGSVYFLLIRSDKEAEIARNTDTSAAPAPAAKKEDPEAKFKANPSNMNAVGNYLKFGQWAYNNAIDWGGDKLIEKFKQDVSVAGVDDPEVNELITLQIDNWHLMPDHPLRPFEATGNGVLEITGDKNNSVALNKYKFNDGKIKGLVQKLRKRYGVNL